MPLHFEPPRYPNKQGCKRAKLARGSLENVHHFASRKFIKLKIGRAL